MGSHFNRKWKNAFALKSASTNVPYFRGKTADSFGQSADTLPLGLLNYLFKSDVGNV